MIARENINHPDSFLCAFFEEESDQSLRRFIQHAIKKATSVIQERLRAATASIHDAQPYQMTYVPKPKGFQWKDRYEHHMLFTALHHVCMLMHDHRCKVSMRGILATSFKLSTSIAFLNVGLRAQVLPIFDALAHFYARLPAAETSPMPLLRQAGEVYLWRAYLCNNREPSLSDCVTMVDTLNSLSFQSNSDLDRWHLIHSLSYYSSVLLQAGRFEESLDCCQQSLVLQNEASTIADWNYGRAVWTASGETSTFYSSTHERACDAYVAFSESVCLSDLAASARMVLVDALSARDAALKAAPCVWFTPDRALLSKQRFLLTSWVSFTMLPNEAGAGHGTINEVD
ncbi:hypothetical protein HGRIS_007268 [Hohenbuehelia grisea]|uniref:Uncharacterized protein n=1 Tax=Hohenbuehelia grisea TaxID=104357 RepID=A0ABR3JCA2_9AGAR